MAEFEFDTQRLARAALGDQAGLREVALDAAQKRLVHDLANLVGPALGIDVIPCRGLWLQAVRRWQLANLKPAEQISETTPAERLRAAFAIKDYFLELAESLLLDPRQKAAVKQTVDRAYELYMSKYNKR